jgi:hypothetical protein
VLQGSYSGTGYPDGNFSNLAFGAGYNGGAWPDEADYEKSGNTGYLQYFKGDIVNIDFSDSEVFGGLLPRRTNQVFGSPEGRYPIVARRQVALFESLELVDSELGTLRRA